MEIPPNYGVQASRFQPTDQVAALRLLYDHLALIAEIANRMAVMYACRIVEKFLRTATLGDRQHPLSFAVPHE
jgi:ABC-type dipeptide/oligopeptide/nickel transport system ATPase component